MIPYNQPNIRHYSRLLAESFSRWTGRLLVDASGDDLPSALYHADFALVSHGTELDPVFRYANNTAQQLWNIGWDEFIHMPSRLSAEPVAIAERQRLLDEAAKNGYVDHYQGVRISKDSRRFTITDTLLWNVVDDKGAMHGQAALIKNWQWL